MEVVRDVYSMINAYMHCHGTVLFYCFIAAEIRLVRAPMAFTNCSTVRSP